jgi:hypothetical protein
MQRFNLRGPSTYICQLQININLFASKFIIYISKNNEIDKAREKLIKVHEMNPEFMTDKVTSGLGEIFMTQGDFEQAIHFFKIQ